MFLAQIAPPNIQLNLPANVPPDWLPWLTLALGVVMLLFGRALYWAFVAIVGFLIGMALAQTWPWLNEQTQIVQLLVALGAACLARFWAYWCSDWRLPLADFLPAAIWRWRS